MDQTQITQFYLHFVHHPLWYSSMFDRHCTAARAVPGIFFATLGLASTLLLTSYSPINIHDSIVSPSANTRLFHRCLYYF